MAEIPGRLAERDPARRTRRSKIPFWVVPVLVVLPLWAFLYWGTLDTAADAEPGLTAEGSEVYGPCATCHGSTGAGGASIPDLTTVTQTFPDFRAHVWWVVNGSDAVPPNSPYGSPDRDGGQRTSNGNMPAWGAGLSAREILAVVHHERGALGDATPAELAVIEAIASSPELPEHFEEGSTLDEITELLDGLMPPEAAGTVAE